MSTIEEKRDKDIVSTKKTHLTKVLRPASLSHKINVLTRLLIRRRRELDIVSLDAVLR